MRAALTLDGGLATRLAARTKAAQDALEGAVLADCEGYIPRDTGRLAASGQAVGGAVEWSAAYARAVYYGRGGEGAQWFERARAVQGGAWVQAAREGFGAG